MAKASHGGVSTPISPAFGASGQYTHPGYTPRPSQVGSPQPDSGYPGPNPNSKYTDERPDQPQPSIDDIDMGSNWYSPFQPLYPFGPPYITRPREWDFPVGYNLNYIPRRIETMSMLRGMARTWGVLATIIATRQDQLLRIPWTIQRRDKPKAGSAGVDELRKFFKSPDGKLKYSQWSRKLLDDLLILDAPTIFFSRDRRGRLLNAEVLDGATIFPLIDDAGRRPDSVWEVTDDGIEYLKRQPAFQQVIKGLPMVDLDESEIIYRPMRPRPDFPIFGFPPTEQILVEASEAIRKTFYQFNFWAEGTLPDLIVTVPESWTPRQIAAYQAHMDALLSRDSRLKSKMRFVPGGMKPFDIKNSSGESLWSQRDETLIRLACYAYSVSPAPFVRMLNRATAQNAQQMAEEEGLYPVMSYYKDDIMDSIIQDQFGYDDLEFVFLPRPEPDLEKQAKIHDLKIKSGEYSINEARDESGLEPIANGDVHMIYIGNQIVPLEMAAKGDAVAMQKPPLGAQAPSPGGKPSAIKPSNQPQRGAAKPTTITSGSAAVKGLIKVDQSRVDQSSASRGQRRAGNYKKDHIRFQGLEISIENRKGSKRKAEDWSGKVPFDYGYIRGTIGADGDQIDVCVGKHLDSPWAFVLDQDKINGEDEDKGFDECKVFLGWNNPRKVYEKYCDANSDGKGPLRCGALTRLSMADFKSWLKNGDVKRPISEQRVGTVLYRRGDDIWKSDTISSSTGLNWYSQTTAVPKKRRDRRRRRSQGPRWLQLGAE
jgi:hypothetical protein